MRRSRGMSPWLALVITILIIGGLGYFFWQAFGNGPVGDAVCTALPFCEKLGLR